MLSSYLEERCSVDDTEIDPWNVMPTSEPTEPMSLMVLGCTLNAESCSTAPAQLRAECVATLRFKVVAFTEVRDDAAIGVHRVFAAIGINR